MNILAILPRNRDLLGTIAIDLVLPPADCLGRSDNEFALLHGNASRDPLKVGGDTPYGEYRCTVERFTTAPDEATLHSYGPYGKIHLWPISGDALTAQQNGRSGICIHSGALNAAYTQWNGLRVSHGCLRVHDNTMLTLLAECEAALGINEVVICTVRTPDA